MYNVTVQYNPTVLSGVGPALESNATESDSVVTVTAIMHGNLREPIFRTLKYTAK